jgi:putative hemolysin
MLEVLIVCSCLLLNGLLAAYEMAFVSVSRSELRSLVKSGKSEAKILLRLREVPERTLSVIQIGITAVGSIAAAVGGAGASDTIEPLLAETFGMSDSSSEVISVIFVVVPITFFSVLIGELVPKSLALRHPLRISMVGVKWIVGAERALAPVVKVLETCTKAFLSLLPQGGKVREEAKDIVEISALPEFQQNYVMNLLQIEGRKIREVMLPWPKVVVVDSNAVFEEIVEIITRSGHTRLPVVKDGTVTGILHTKEFMLLKESGFEDWWTIVRPPLFVGASELALRVMRLLQERRYHMAIVGSVGQSPLGIVTLEDILEEIVGDIYDEDDDGRMRSAVMTKTRIKLSKDRNP